MSKILYIIICLIIVILSGCQGTATVKFNSSLTRDSNCTGKATISINRELKHRNYGVSAIINDSDIIIGEIGPGGNLSWCRPPGYIALLSSPTIPVSRHHLSYWSKPTHLIIFPVEAGKTYSLSTDFQTNLGSIFALVEPDNFPKDTIKYEAFAEKARFSTEGYAPISDTVWKEELNKLKP